MTQPDKSDSAAARQGWRAGLAMAWWLGAELPPNRRHPIAIMGESFSAAIRAATGDLGRRPLTQSERVLRLQHAYIVGDITARSLELELEHLPGGLPALEDE